ncbi:hypothetical protein SAMN05661080_03013 [Modestobacter sp. DSM 44400]|uniref:hypothetical protein n=1 Tax=Modestobacter sp. DSM 44400 TaxID=1550230 RepID=UPI0008960B87|nr:hypothetical protein [Modestobacter sp. DSM 44400]SDY30297.1 hypothetical protein SAMN05661080_03013 [Modestobacter sp. DSM 44400]
MSTVPEVARNVPAVLESEFSLVTAVTRLDFLSRRDNHVIDAPNDAADDDDDWAAIKEATTTLDVDEALELLALGEVVARKAHDSRQAGVRAARRGGAEWADIAAALDISPAQAWDEHTAWLDEQGAAAARGDADALDAAAVGQLRELAGPRPAGPRPA